MKNRMKRGRIATVALLSALGVAFVMPVPADAAATKGKATKSATTKSATTKKATTKKAATKSSANEIAALKRELAEQRALIDKLLATQSTQKATIDKIETRTTQAPAEVYGHASIQTTPAQGAAQTLNSLLPKGINLYGRVDVSVANTDSGFGRKFTVGSAGMTATSLGLKGEKELAYGLKAVGQVEMGVDLSTGVVGNGPVTLGDQNTVASSGGLTGSGSQIFSRQAFAGLASKDFGQVTLGRQYSGSYLAVANEGTAFGPGFYGSSATFLPVIGTMPTRVNNGIVYQTPAFDGFMKGFSVYATYTAGSENNDDSRGGPHNSSGNIVSTDRVTDASGEGYDLALFYRHKAQGWGWNGERQPTDGLTVGATAWTVKRASYDISGGSNGLGPKETGLATNRGWQVLASYDFGVAKIYGNYVSGWISGGNYANVTKKLSDADGWSFSAKVPFLGKHAVIANYSILNDKSLLDQDASMLGIAYTYEIVKDTWLYASWGQLFNDKHGAYSLMNGGDLVGNIGHAGYEPDGIMLGVNTKF